MSGFGPLGSLALGQAVSGETREFREILKTIDLHGSMPGPRAHSNPLRRAAVGKAGGSSLPLTGSRISVIRLRGNIGAP